MTEETKKNGLNDDNQEVHKDETSQTDPGAEKKEETGEILEDLTEGSEEEKPAETETEDATATEKSEEVVKEEEVEEAADVKEVTAEETSEVKGEKKEEKEEAVEEKAEVKEELAEEKQEETETVADETEKKEGPSEKPESTKKTPEFKQIPPEEFNWDAIGKKEQTYSKEEKEKLEKLYDKTLSVVQEGEVVEGTIMALNKREVVVNIDYKSEGIINANEFRYEPDLKAGDKVEVFIEKIDDGDGQLIISHNKAKSLKAWERINKAYENDEIIKGYIKCRTKGGMIVDVFGIEAFLPGSQIDVKPIRDYDVFVDKTMDFKIVKINEEFKNVVVSHKALIEAELEEQKKEIIARLEKGQVLEGIVKNITSYGVFIDLGGVDGLIHITDLSWGRVNHPEEIVSLDEKINVVILDFDDEKKRIALGYKQLTPHPWDSLEEDIKVGDKVEGKVVVLADYGAFIEIKPGVEGLIHVSEMSWSQHLRSAQDFMKVGDAVDAVILTLDREERKMSLGIKQLHPDPWNEINKRYPVDSKHTAKVRNFTNFGVFVELEEGVDGLVHISDLSWTKKVKHPAEFTSIDADLEVVVLEIDEENRRLSLGHKQIEENPWDVFETIFSVDSIHEGTIVESNEKGSIIALPYGVEGFATPKHLVKENGESAKLDEKLNFKVIEFNKDSKKIFVSHSRIHEDIERQKIAEEKRAQRGDAKITGKKVKKVTDKIEKTTLGDITDLAALKKELSQKEKDKTAAEKKVKEEKAVDETKKAEVKVDKTTDAKEDAVVEETKTKAKKTKEKEKEDENKETKKTTKKKAKAKSDEKDESKADEAEVEEKKEAKKKKTTAKSKKETKEKSSDEKKDTTKKKTAAKKKKAVEKDEDKKEGKEPKEEDKSDDKAE